MKPALLQPIVHVLVLVVLLNGLFVTEAFPREKPAAGSPQAEASTTARPRLPLKFRRWINRRTRPVGLALEKVLPFRLAKVQRQPLWHMCFPADTRISLPGGTTCAISALQVGQSVMGWNQSTGRLDTVRVEALAAVVHDSLRQLSFADGRTVTATADHPFWVRDIGWASLAPALTTARYTNGLAQLLQPGANCLVFNGTAALVPTQLSKVVDLTQCSVPTYTITRLSRGNVFFANGLAVGTEGSRGGKRNKKQLQAL